MIKKYLGVILLVVLLVTGCRGRLNYLPVSEPSINEVSIAAVGDAMLQQGYGLIAPVIRFSSAQTIGDFEIPVGAYKTNTENREGYWFWSARSKLNGREGWILLNRSGQICIDKICAPVAYEIIENKVYAWQPNVFQQTLLYSGKSGSRILVSYREFVNDMARPAFTNEVNYDLAESKIIGYKGAKLEVLDATNVEIKYRVISNFNSAKQ